MGFSRRNPYPPCWGYQLFSLSWSPWISIWFYLDPLPRISRNSQNFSLNLPPPLEINLFPPLGEKSLMNNMDLIFFLNWWFFSKFFFSLRDRQAQWERDEKERIANIPDPTIPPGHVLMDSNERKVTLEKLKKCECCCYSYRVSFNFFSI